MSQGPIGTLIHGLNPENQARPIRINEDGTLPVSTSPAPAGQVIAQTLDVTADTEIAGPNSTCITVCVTTAGSVPGTLHNCADIGSATSSNIFFTVPNTVGVYQLNWPTDIGLVYKAGTAQVISVLFSSAS